MWNRGAKYIIGVVVVAVVALGLSAQVGAETSQSTNYQAIDTHFGPASMIGSCSDKYCADISIGSNNASDAAGGSSSASFHSLSVNHPQLDLIIDAGESNLGVLSPEKTSYKTMTVRVRSYISGGYTLQMMGTPPHFASHTLKALDTQTASQPGHEQFGINVVANTTPEVGKDPKQIDPDQPNVGQVAPGYATANKFMYHSGDMIASSQENSGRTDYTISMIVNVANSTPAGHYSGDFALVIVAGF